MTGFSSNDATLVAVDVHDTEVDRNLAREHGKRRRSATRDVPVHERREVECREQVAVHHEHAVLREIHLRDRAGRSERLRLAPVDELDAEPLTVAEVRLDQLGEVADREVDADEARRREPSQQDLEHRHVADRHQRLRQDGRVRPQPCSRSAGEHDDVAHQTL